MSIQFADSSSFSNNRGIISLTSAYTLPSPKTGRNMSGAKPQPPNTSQRLSMALFPFFEAVNDMRNIIGRAAEMHGKPYSRRAFWHSRRPYGRRFYAALHEKCGKLKSFAVAFNNARARSVSWNSTCQSPVILLLRKMIAPFPEAVFPFPDAAVCGGPRQYRAQAQTAAGPLNRSRLRALLTKQSLSICASGEKSSKTRRGLAQGAHEQHRCLSQPRIPR